MPQGQRALRALLAVSCPPAAGLGATPIPPQTADGSTRRTPSATDWGTHLFPRNSFLIRLAEAELTVGCFSTHLGFCSFHSHCDSVFQQSDQLSGTVSALVPSLKRAASFPMWVRVFPCGCEFSHVGASFPTCTSPTRWKSRRHKRRGCTFSHVGASFQLAPYPSRKYPTDSAGEAFRAVRCGSFNARCPLKSRGEIEAGRSRLESIVEKAVGVKLVSVHHDISTVTGEEILVFSLAEPPACRPKKKA